MARFPNNHMRGIANAKEMLNKGKITQEQYDAWFNSWADYYDNIKPSECWWDRDSIETYHEADYPNDPMKSGSKSGKVVHP